MSLEQVVPVVPQGTFSVTTRKVSRVLPFPLHWSWGAEGHSLMGQDPQGSREPLATPSQLRTCTSVYSQAPLKL